MDQLIKVVHVTCTVNAFSKYTFFCEEYFKESLINHLMQYSLNDSFQIELVWFCISQWPSDDVEDY